MSDAIRELIGELTERLTGLPQRLGYPDDWVYYYMAIGVKLPKDVFMQLLVELQETKNGKALAYNVHAGRARGQFLLSPTGLAMMESALAEVKQ